MIRAKDAINARDHPTIKCKCYEKPQTDAQFYSKCKNPDEVANGYSTKTYAPHADAAESCATPLWMFRANKAVGGADDGAAAIADSILDFEVFRSEIRPPENTEDDVFCGGTDIVSFDLHPVGRVVSPVLEM